MAGGERIVIHPRRRLIYGALILIWLLTWGIGEAVVAGVLLTNRVPSGAPLVFGYTWMIAWTIAGGWVLFAVIWEFLGREIVTVATNELTIEKKIASFRARETFVASAVTKMRLEERRHRYKGRQLLTRAIGFDYAGQRKRFGRGLSVKEAEVILDGPLKRFVDSGGTQS